MERLKQGGRTAVLALTYWLLASIGQSLGMSGQMISPVWPPAGIALGALIVWGNGLWPGILGGAVVAGLTAGLPSWLALLLGLINTGEALVASLLLRQAAFAPDLPRVRDVLALVALAGVLAPILAATLAVTALTMTGLISWAQWPAALAIWWLGNATGMLVFVPAVLAWARRRPPWLGRPASWEAPALAAATLATAIGVFTPRWAGPGFEHVPLAFLAFPVLVWAALRYGYRGITATLIPIIAWATWLTVHGLGPLAYDGLLVALIRLQVFAGVVTVTALLLAAVMNERDCALYELAAAKQRAEDADRAKSRLLAAARHDLAQPLQAAQIFTTILAQRSDPAGRELVARLKGALDAFNDTLASLRDLSLLEAGMVKPQVHPFALPQVLDQIDAECRIQATGKGLDWRYARCSAVVCSDPALLARILRNLASNALRYTRSGRILIGCRRRGDRMVIEVHDTGPGIPPDKIETIFEAFQRLEPSRGEGLGLGLAIVRQFAGLLNCTLTVRSIPGRGSAFCVSVPLAAIPAPERRCHENHRDSS